MISVVIPAYNAEETIADCVRSLQRQATKQRYQILVVDNNSTDETAQRARVAGACVLKAERQGAAAARNAGIRAAKGEIICFTDADCEPAPDWIEQITAPFADPSVAGCKGVYTTRQRQLIARFVQLEYEDKYDRLRTQPRIDFIDTYSAAYRRQLLLANNGFDERIHYVEDQELSFRLAAQGCQMVFQPDAVVAHLHSDSVADYMRKKFWIAYWKAQIVRRVPARGVKDSHTPQIMKLQMGLVTLLLPALFLSRLVSALRWLAGSLTLTFVASTLPFAAKAWRKDRAVALLSPILLALRAAALSAGAIWGFLRPRSNHDG